MCQSISSHPFFQLSINTQTFWFWNCMYSDFFSSVLCGSYNPCNKNEIFWNLVCGFWTGFQVDLIGSGRVGPTCHRQVLSNSYGCGLANGEPSLVPFLYHELFGWVISTNPKCRMEGAKKNITGVTGTIRCRNSNHFGSFSLVVLIPNETRKNI